MTSVLTQIHNMEEELILIEGLVKALQQMLPVDYAQDCVVHTLQQKHKDLHQEFYKLWGTVLSSGL